MVKPPCSVAQQSAHTGGKPVCGQEEGKSATCSSSVLHIHKTEQRSRRTWHNVVGQTSRDQQGRLVSSWVGWCPQIGEASIAQGGSVLQLSTKQLGELFMRFSAPHTNTPPALPPTPAGDSSCPGGTSSFGEHEVAGERGRVSAHKHYTLATLPTPACGSCCPACPAKCAVQRNQTTTHAHKHAPACFPHLQVAAVVQRVQRNARVQRNEQRSNCTVAGAKGCVASTQEQEACVHQAPGTEGHIYEEKCEHLQISEAVRLSCETPV